MGDTSGVWTGTLVYAGLFFVLAVPSSYYVKAHTSDPRQKGENFKLAWILSAVAIGYPEPLRTLPKASHDQSSSISIPLNKQFDPPPVKPAFPKLSLDVIESEQLQLGSQLLIDPSGLENSRRGVKDGVTYFGSASIRPKSPGNDFIWPAPEEGIGPQHFSIRFEEKKQGYWIQDSGEGNGTFLRISSWMSVSPRAVVTFEDSYAVAETNTEKRLSLKFIEGPKTGQNFEFSPSDEVIFIGRMTDCRVILEENCQSRYLVAFKYAGEAGWLVADGDGKRPSAHGVWLFVDEGWKLKTGHEIRVGQTIFRVSLSN